MNMSSDGGYLLSGIRIIVNKDSATPSTEPGEKASSEKPASAKKKRRR